MFKMIFDVKGFSILAIPLNPFMKKILLVFFVLATHHTYSQDSILLAMHFKPMLNYYNVSSQKMHIEVSYVFDDTTENVVDLRNPNIRDISFLMKLMTRTGALKNEKIPVETEYLESVNQDNAAVIPPGTKIFGTAIPGKQTVYDSISEMQGNEEYRKVLLATLQSMLSQIQIPEKRMAIGDEFLTETPLTMNMSGINLDMVCLQTYKLISATRETANFDIRMKYKMKIQSDEVPGLPFSGNGEGEGTLLLDRTNDYPLKYDFHYKMNYGFKKEGITFNSKLLASFNQEITITKDRIANCYFFIYLFQMTPGMLNSIYDRRLNII